MMHIKRFIDKMAAMESKQSKDIVLPIIEARGLRDDIAKLLTDLHKLTSDQNDIEEVIKVEITGGTFK
jgi:hypothetical protein